jgi:hypothetical protein
MPTVKELNARISRAKKDIEKLKIKLVKDTQMLFKQSVKDIFKKHKELISFSWTQFTPHWNDGDSCQFSANTDYIYLNGSEESESLWDNQNLYNDLLDYESVRNKLKAENVKLAKKKDQKWRIESNERKLEELENADIKQVKWKTEVLKDINGLLDMADTDALLEMFNDHVKVTVTKDGIETEDYEHD